MKQGQRAKALASEIGSYHLNINIDTLVNALQKLFTGITGRTPQFKTEGGSSSGESSIAKHSGETSNGHQLSIRADVTLGSQ